MSDAVWVPVNAEMKGFVATLVKEASGAAKKGSSAIEKEFEAGGKKAGEAVASGLADSARKVEQISVKLGSARKAEAQAAADVSVAEQKLNSLRDSGSAKASQIAAAEQKLETAKNKQSDASVRVAREEQNLEAARNGGETKSLALSRAEDSLATARTNQATAAARVKTADLQIDEARAAAKAKADAVATAEMKLIDTRDRYGANTKETAAAERELERARSQADTANQKVATAEGNAKKRRAELASTTDTLKAKEMTLKATQEDVANSMKESSSETDQLDDKLSSLAGAAKTAIEGFVGFSVIKETLWNVGMAFDDMYDSIRVGTGASGAAFADLQQSARNVADTIPAMDGGMAQIGTTLADLNTRLGATGPDLETLTAQFVQLQNIGVDADINEVSKALQGFGVSASDAPAAMDKLFQISQATGLTITELAQSAVKGGPQLRQFGFDMGDAAALVGTLDKAGLDADKTIAGMGRALMNFAKDGKDAPQALRDTVTEIGNLIASGDEAKALDLAGGLFGTRGAAQFVDAVKTGALSVEDFVKATGATEDTILGIAEETADGAEAWQLFKQQAMLAIEPIATMVFNTLTPVLSGMATVLNGVSTAFQTLGKWLAPFKPVLLGVAAGFTALTIASVAYTAVAKVQAAGGLVAAFGKLAGMLRKTAAAQWLFNSAVLANPITWIVAGIVAAGVALWAFFTKTEAGRQMWESFTNAIVTGWDWVTEKLGAGIEWVKNAFSGIKSLFIDGDFTGALARAFGVEEDSPIVGFFFDLRDTAIQAFDWITAKLTEFGTGFMLFYTTWIQPVVTFMSAAFQTFGTVISTVWSVMVMPVLNFFGSVLQTLGQVVMSVVQAVIIPAWNFLGAQISNIWHNVVNPVFGFFRSVVGLLADVLTGNFSNIGNRFSEMGQALAGVVRGVITATMNTFKNIVRMVGDAFNNFKALVASAMSAVVGKIQEMVNKVTAIPGKIKSAFSSAGSWLSSAGRDLISGFANGIRSASGWIVDAIKSLVPDSLERFLPFADGGFFFANGGTREDHRAHIAPAGSWRVFGEPETGGEAYIPLAASKRKRSEAIANYVAERFGFTLVDKRTGEPYDGAYSGNLGPTGGPSLTQAFADGGVTGDDLLKFVQGKRVRGQQAALPLEGAPYIWGGQHPRWGDCSGTVSTVAAFAVGQNPAPRRFSTASEASWLSSNGFKRGRGKQGDLRIGFRNGGPAGGHTSGTLPNGTNFEMGGGRGNGQVGGRAAGAWDSYYNEFFYRTIAKPKPKKPKYTPVSTDSTAGMTVVDADTLDVSTGTSETEKVTVALSPEDAAKATAAKELGDQSILDLAVDGVFAALGMKDSVTKKLLTTKGNDLFPKGDSIITTRDEARTTRAAKSAQAIEAKSAEKVSPADAAKDPQLGGSQPKKKLPQWGMDFFAREIARSAKDHKLPVKGAMIGEAVALVESGDPMRMWANRAVPESMKFRHDAVGSDHDSIGLFQQRNAGWGTVKQRMTPYESAGLFFRAMLRKFPNWQQMEPGKVAQGVQVSAFPDRYAMKMNRGMELAKKSGIYAAAKTDKAAKVVVKNSVDLKTAFQEYAAAWDQSDFGLAETARMIGEGDARNVLNLVESAGRKSGVASAKAGPVASYKRLAQVGDYDGRMAAIGIDEDHKLVDGVLKARKAGSVFDQGGVGRGKGVLPKDVVAPERVLSPQQTRTFDDLVYKELPKRRNDGNGTTVVINIDGQEVLRKRVDRVEGQVHINTEELNSLRRRTSVAVAGTTRGGAV